MPDLYRVTGTGTQESLDIKEYRGASQTLAQFQASDVNLYTWNGTQLVALGSNVTPTGPAVDPPPGSTAVSLPLAQKQAPYLIAHRGADRRFPEGALYSFDHAAWYPELILDADLQITTSGDLICLHDATLDRTSAPLTGSFAGYTETSWRTVPMNWPTGSTWQPQPDVFGCTWKQLADKWGGRRVISVKPESDEACTAVVADIKRRGIQDRILFVSGILTRCQQAMDAGMPALLDFFVNSIPDLAAAQAAGLWGIGVYPSHITNNPGLIADANARGLKVFVNTINSQADMTTRMQAGAVGFPSDNVFGLLGKEAPSDTQLGLIDPGQVPVGGSTSTRFGACPVYPPGGTSASVRNAVVTKYGTGSFIRVFYSSVPTAMTLTKTPGASGEHWSWSMGGNYQAFIDGTYDTILANIFRNLDPTYWVVEGVHEIDRKIYGTGIVNIASLADAITLKNKFYDLVKSVNPNLKVANTFTAYQFDTANTNYGRIEGYRTMKADVLGLDMDGVHPKGGLLPYTDYRVETAQAIKWCNDVPIYKDWSIPEWGTSPATNDADQTAYRAWMKDLGDFWRTHPTKKPLYACWYDAQNAEDITAPSDFLDNQTTINTLRTLVATA